MRTKLLWTYAVALGGAFLSGLNLAVTSFEAPFLNWLFHLPPDAAHDGDRVIANLALSLFAMIATTLTGMFLLTGEIQSAARASSDDLNDALRQLPQARVFGAFLNGDEALSYLTHRLPEAAVIRNTRLINASSLTNAMKGKNRDEYERAYCAALKSAFAWDVVSPAWEENARKLRETTSDSYHFHVLEVTLPSFLNFSVIEYRDGEPEVLFGWAISEDGGFGHSCFRTTETRVVEFFKRWHQDLYIAGRAPGPAATAAAAP